MHVVFAICQVEESDEVLMICKTRTALFDKIAAKVKILHPYKVPEIVALPMAAALQQYAKWIGDVTTATPDTVFWP